MSRAHLDTCSTPRSCRARRGRADLLGVAQRIEQLLARARFTQQAIPGDQKQRTWGGPKLALSASSGLMVRMSWYGSRSQFLRTRISLASIILAARVGDRNRAVHYSVNHHMPNGRFPPYFCARFARHWQRADHMSRAGRGATADHRQKRKHKTLNAPRRGVITAPSALFTMRSASSTSAARAASARAHFARLGSPRAARVLHVEYGFMS